MRKLQKHEPKLFYVCIIHLEIFKKAKNQCKVLEVHCRFGNISIAKCDVIFHFGAGVEGQNA